MENESDLRKHFEAILGREIVDLSDGGIQLREFIGLYSSEEGQATSREIVFNGPPAQGCSEGRLFSIGGLAVTGAEGKAEFLLSEYHCSERILPEHPIIFVATAQTRDPVFVTSATFIVTNDDGARDVRVEIYTWDPNGDPARSKLVKWFCRFPTSPVIL